MDVSTFFTLGGHTNLFPNFGLKFWHILKRLPKDPSVILLNHCESIAIPKKKLIFFAFDGSKEHNYTIALFWERLAILKKENWFLKLWDYIMFDKISNSLLFNESRYPLYLDYKCSSILEYFMQQKKLKCKISDYIKTIY